MKDQTTKIENPAPKILSQFSIKTEGLSKRFNREWIFKNLNYTFNSGQTYAITGPNGSGKSTLLQVLWGQLPQTSGVLSYSSSAKNLPIEEIFNHVSIATPYMDLIDEFTLIEQLGFHFKLRKLREGVSSFDELIDLLYFNDARDKQITNFSSGMKQRLKLGLAFYTQAQVLFLDEPGTNLDSKGYTWYKQNLNSLNKDQLIMIASNQADEYPENATILKMTDFK